MPCAPRSQLWCPGKEIAGLIPFKALLKTSEQSKAGAFPSFHILSFQSIQQEGWVSWVAKFWRDGFIWSDVPRNKKVSVALWACKQRVWELNGRKTPWPHDFLFHRAEPRGFLEASHEGWVMGTPHSWARLQKSHETPDKCYVCAKVPVKLMGVKCMVKCYI